MRPPVPYFGGKQQIAAQIVSYFPAHEHYVEPFAGGLSVWSNRALAHQGELDLGVG
ncbi:DNA adenine methylase [Cellulomonas sp. RIT-PI-Y]|uniref:DNA adenine methylase n=1 Tax=Cellulomonas sp. RIT-PI-Y TaxID=3035297 RepID=UPI0021D9849B|nr:DNA adenine methylase [Cellulomonas sp. RIT-PI-Y]